MVFAGHQDGIRSLVAARFKLYVEIKTNIHSKHFWSLDQLACLYMSTLAIVRIESDALYNRSTTSSIG
jgi:hypothetical protein